MRKSLLFLLIVVSLFCSGCGKTPINEIPMYGGIEFTSEQKEINDKFIQAVVKQYGNRKAAAEDAVRWGWNYYNEKHDPKTAMKRFNQAWLLDPNNAGAFFGFGFLMAEKGKEDEAIAYYKKSMELDPNNAVVICNLGRIYENKAYRLRRQRKREEMIKCLDEAMKLYEKASQVAATDDDLGYIYYSWAVALELMDNYAGAWDKIKLVRKHDGHYIEPGFIKHMSRSMPEPK
jgi:tetratricopeptide (TPR) repeat protein